MAMMAKPLSTSVERDAVVTALNRCGTREAVPPAVVLSAGDLRCEWTEGSIRHLRWRGVELIRCIAYLFRDTDWGTVPGQVSGMEVDASPSAFVVRFGLLMTMPAGSLRARVQISGSATGQFSFEVEAVADAALLTNRCGLVVLHPASAAGAPLVIEHTDGSAEKTRFPELISPGQVAFNIRSLRHEPLPGLSVDCRLEAELPHDPLGKFEMEDQRNWSDASFKTYVASLLDPWPYGLEAGRPFSQQVTVSVADLRDRGRAVETAAESIPARMLVSQGSGIRLPAIGLGVPLGLAGMTAAERAGVMALRPDWLMAEVDAADAKGLQETLAALAELARAAGARVQLDVICPEGLGPQALAARLLVACQLGGLAPEAVRACPAAYLKSYQPSGRWPQGPALEAFAAALALAFPHAQIGGGMLTYFTELNRKRQPPASLDFVGHTTTPLVHAADDVSVMQTHESLASIAASVHAVWPSLAYRLGPATIGMHRNPYGERTADNPQRSRMAMAADDPRHQAAFGAAWLVGYAAAVQGCDVEVLSLLHAHGVSGPMLRADMPGWQAGACVPAWRVLHRLARASGCALARLSGVPEGLAALAWYRADGRREVLLANLGAEALTTCIAGAWAIEVLSEPCTTHALAAAEPGGGVSGAPPLAADTPLCFEGYQVLWLTD